MDGSIEKASSYTSEAINAKEEEAEKALTRKIDWNLLPILTLLYLLSFLDRSNVGNAKIDGLATQINLKGAEYNTGLALYFVGYVLFEIPANIVLKRTSPKVWLPTITLVWGFISVCQGLVVNKAGFYAVRFILGATEAGLFPGVTYVFSMYYTRRQRSRRVSFFFSGSALAGAFGGVLAYLLGLIKGGGKPGWAWIFIVEGLITIVASLSAYFLVPSWPQHASFLTEQERDRLIARLCCDTDSAYLEPFNWRGVKQALTDPLSYLYGLIFHGGAFTMYSISLFLPTIINNLGFATWKAQLLTTPPYVVTFIITNLVVWKTAKHNCIAFSIVISSFVALVGYVILIATPTAGSQYFGTFVIVCGVYTANALLLSWPGENVSAQTKRAVVLALQITLGDMGAITGTLVYRPSLSAHNFRTPNIIAIGYTFVVAFAALALWFVMRRENDKRDRLAASGNQSTGNTENAMGSKSWANGWNEQEESKSRRELGDRHPSWRYRI